MNLDYPYHFDGRGRTAEADRRRPRPRPDRAGAVHRARRARQSARLRQRPAAAGVRAATAELAAATQMLVQGALQQWLGDLIAVERRARSRPRTPTLRVSVATSCAAPASAQSRRSAAAGAMIYHCCDELRRNAVARTRRSTASTISRSSTAMRRRAARGSARCSSACSSRCRRPGARATAHRAAASAMRDIRIEWAARGIGAAGAATRRGAGLFARCPSPTTCSSSAPTAAATSRPTCCALVALRPTTAPPAGFDPQPVRRSTSRSRSNARATSTAAGTACPPDEPPPAPEIDYLAKDYASFRRLMLDRLAQLCPTGASAAPPTSASRWSSCWPTSATTSATGRTRSPPRPTSAPRAGASRCAATRCWSTTRMHDGCNARAWVHVAGRAPPTSRCAQTGTRFYPASPRRRRPASCPTRSTTRRALRRTPGRVRAAARCDALQRAPQRDALLHLGRPALLPAAAARRGRRCAATSPTSRRATCWSSRRCSARAPATPADADPAHRHAVRLTDGVTLTVDDPTPLHRPAHRRADHRDRVGRRGRAAVPALPSARTDEAHGASSSTTSASRAATWCSPTTACTRRRTRPRHGARAAPVLRAPTATRRAAAASADPVPPRFRPPLARRAADAGRHVLKTASRRRDATGGVAFDPDAPPPRRCSGASTTCCRRSRSPARSGRAADWGARRDLLDSAADDPHFVVEIEDDGRRVCASATTARPAARRPATAFAATYRVGNGAAGNVGADTDRARRHARRRTSLAVRNPLPARGGIDPETARQVRRRAPAGVPHARSARSRRPTTPR